MASGKRSGRDDKPERELAYRLRQQQVLSEFGLFALRCDSLQRLLDEAVRVAAWGLETEFAKVLEFQPGDNRLLVRAGIGWRPGVVGNATIGADLASPAGYALRTGLPVLSNQLAGEQRFRTPELLAEHGVRRAINAVIGGPDPFGVLEVDSHLEGRFTNHDIAFLQGVANLLAVAIDRQRTVATRTLLLAEANAHRVRLQALARASVAIAAAPTLPSAIRKLTDEARAIVGCELAATHNILGLDWSGVTITVSVSDRYAKWRDYEENPTGAGIYGAVIRSGQPLRLTRAELPRHPEWRGFGESARRHPPLSGLLAAPLRASDGRNLGVLMLSDKREGEFTPGDEAILVHLAQLGAMVIDKAMAEQNLRHLTETLEHEVAERSAALREREEALAQARKMEAIGRSTGTIAHDFNNILQVITGNLTMLQDQLADQPGLARFAVAATSAAGRGEKMAQELLAFSREPRPQTESLDINEAIVGVEELLVQQLGPNVALRKTLAEDLAPALADSGQFERALLNLVVNARDAMPGGGCITIETGNAFLGHGQVPGVAPGGYVRVTVRDTGIGMPESVRERVFEPFFTTKPSGAGTGLGLSMVYGFIRQSRGSVSIDSVEGRGTAVTMFLPQSLPEGAPQA
jgi:signal transduction histidine kinase